jgi:tricorn protease
MPGARLELDGERYRIALIYDGQNEEERYRCPLTEIGVNAHEGDYVLAIDGEELQGTDNPYRLLRNKADRPVTLTLNDRPSREGAREVTYQPITNERNVRYLTWVGEKRRHVDDATNGRVGYLHIPDMSASGLYEFIKWYYPQIRREGLVIDVRGNGGGNVSQMLIERLRRTVLRFRYVRTYDRPLTYPNVTFYGHLVCLLNETSASDGDIFPAMFRRAGLGPLIGKRSWGGVTGITGHGPLLDGGIIYVPQFGTNDLDGSWIIEGHGVDPDIEVDNTPESILRGEDAQLDRAIEEVLKAIDAEPKTIPPRPKPPVKTQ